MQFLLKLLPNFVRRLSKDAFESACLNLQELFGDQLFKSNYLKNFAYQTSMKTFFGGQVPVFKKDFFHNTVLL